MVVNGRVELGRAGGVFRYGFGFSISVRLGFAPAGSDKGIEVGVNLGGDLAFDVAVWGCAGAGAGSEDDGLLGGVIVVVVVGVS